VPRVSSAVRLPQHQPSSAGRGAFARGLSAIAVAALAASAVAAPPTFDERVARAKAAELTPALKPFFTAMGAKIEPNLRSGVVNCLAKFKEPDLTTFIIVADANMNGEAKKIDVQPHTNVSDCFAKAFEFAPLPRLAPYTKDPTLPIFFQIELK